VSEPSCARSTGGRLVGQTYFITGSTDGIGKHTAKCLLAKGANVIVHGRCASRLQLGRQLVRALMANLRRQPVRVADAVAELRNVKGGGAISAYTRDVSTVAEVKALAADVRKEHERIDVLINNAGVYQSNSKCALFCLTAPRHTSLSVSTQDHCRRTRVHLGC